MHINIIVVQLESQDDHTHSKDYEYVQYTVYQQRFDTCCIKCSFTMRDETRAVSSNKLPSDQTYVLDNIS